MSKRFEIDMGLNASDVAKGAKDAESALEQLEQAVGNVGDASGDAGGDISDFTRKVVAAAREAGKSDDDIRDALRKYGVNAKEAERAIERIGDEFKDAGRDGERALDDLEDSLRDVQRQTEKLGDDTTDAGRKMKRGMDDAGEGVKEFKDEANSTAREAAASFDGSAESIADAFQEVAANAFGGFGPAGRIAGLGAAVGIGLAIAGFDNVGKAEEESRERAADWAQAFVDAGSRILNSTVTVAKQVEIATDGEQYKVAAENAKNWGVDVSTAIAAMAGETWALDAANAALTESERKAAEEAVKLADGGEVLADQLLGASGQARAGRDALNQLNGEIDAGRAQFDALSDSLLKTIENEKDATVRTDDLGNSIVALPGGREILIDAKTGKATTDVSRFGKDTDGVIRRLNGRDIVLEAKANVSAAQGAFDRLISRNNGRTIQFKTRVISPVGGDL